MVKILYFCKFYKILWPCENILLLPGPWKGPWCLSFISFMVNSHLLVTASQVGFWSMDLCVMCLNTMLKVNNNRTLFHFCFVWNVIVSNCWHISKCRILNHHAFCWYLCEFSFLKVSWAMTHFVYQKVSSCHCGRKFL